MRDRLTPVLFAWNDLLLSLLACLLVAAFLISVQQKQETPKETDRSAGNVSVFIFWPEGDTDIDTHLRSPDGEHVFFSHRAGHIWNLLRDDLGNTNDATLRNFENAYARGLPPGEYIVNVHCFRNNAKFPVKIDGELRIQGDLDKTSAVTFNAHATLDRVGDEATLFRFSIDNDGNLVPGSVNSQFVRLAGEDK